MSRGYVFTRPSQTDGTPGDLSTPTVWNDAFEAARLVLLNQIASMIDSDMSFVFDQLGETGVDNLIYSYKDSNTVTVAAGVAAADDGLASYSIANPTDVDLTAAASTRYYLWIGQDSITEETTFKFHTSRTSPPANIVHEHCLRWFIETDGSSNIIQFAPPKLNLDRGLPVPYAGRYRPLNCILADGTDYTRTDADLAGLYAEIGHIYDRSFTADAGTDYITSTAHGFVNNDTVNVYLASTTGALPAGLTAGTTYYVINKTADTCQLSLSLGGAAVNITDAGTGYFTVMKTTLFRVPDARGRAWFGAGTGTGLTTRYHGQKLGEEAHSNTEAENGPHTHVPHVNTMSYPDGNGAARTTFTGGGYYIYSANATGSSGSGTAHNTMPPSVVGQYVLAF